MYYEINVSKNGDHFFATSDRSISCKNKLIAVLGNFVRSFPKDEGYEIKVYIVEKKYIPVELEGKYQFAI